MKEHLIKLWNSNDIPIGVRVLTFATSIRWIGWGVAESLIPVFLFTFGHSYANAGILKSFYDIAFILAIPLIGVLADRMRGTTIILIGLSFYIFVGTGYYLAGLTGLVIFIIIARFMNGLGYAFDSVGRETYFRRHTPKEKLATVFGYFDSVGIFWWIVAALFGILLVKFFSIPLLLFLITPTVLIAMFIIWRFRKKEKQEVFSDDQKRARFRDILRDFKAWDWRLKLLASFNFFISFSVSSVYFFLPIEIYTQGGGYTPVIVMGVIMSLPALLGWGLGNFFDRKGIRVFGYGLLCLAILLALLGFITGYIWQIAIAFGIGIITELLWVGSQELMTLYTKPDHFGRVDGISRSIDNAGDLIGPLLAGVVIDIWGPDVTYFGMALLVMAMTAVFLVGSRHMKRKAINI
ncbi:MAG: MFS transporter [bacterium]